MQTTSISQTVGSEMFPSKGAVKSWLKATGKNRDWLATQCGVSKRTVDCWFSSSGKIPAKAILILQSLMSEVENNVSVKDSNTVDSSCFKFGIDLSKAPQRFVVLVLQVAQQLETTPEKAVNCIFEAVMQSKDFAAFVEERKEEVCHA
ncbi:hypothetical protein [Akkermansia sp.]|jgi:hypothetical protein|uniref:hypothetical protein n=1 Tax=Akkermansia sp. TaxID=1872421 RepID=UPI001DC1EBDF|nr:hypothetical protein [Akkermansia sp.]MBE5697706.1 hypothetical protein [Akkermansia sp.]DAW89266.1 MAG TPA: Regulatory protein-modification, helix-turn-helix, transcriptional regulator, DNA [Bacteriophage sp.]DAZ37885.1 MAG TPA: Regulatory protein-modification, helix-turn-helix, transcriptional regulator, DNA [Caudoviricetes sp.]